jgi:hypothetical protein
MPMCLSSSQDDSIPMCRSHSHCQAVIMCQPKAVDPTLTLNRHVESIWCAWTRFGTAVYPSPNEVFCNDEQKMRCVFSKHFSRSWELDLGYESLKTQSKMRISSFVHRYKKLRLGSIQLVHAFHDTGHAGRGKSLKMTTARSVRFVVNLGLGLVFMVC